MQNKKLKIIKVVVTLIIFAVLVVSGSLITKTPLKERGIVVGLGLDKENDEIILLAQVVVSGESSTPGSASAFDLLEGKGKTLSEAFDDLSSKVTLTPSYSHCNILFIGKNLLEDNFDEIASKLFDNNKIKDNTQLVVSDNAKDTMLTVVPIAQTPSEYMEREVKITAENGGRSIVSLKNYLQRTDITSGTRYITYAKKVPATPPTGENTSKGDKEVFLFDLSNTAVFDLDGKVHYYGSEVTEGVGLVEATGGSITAYEGDKHITVDILKSYKFRTYQKDPAKIISDYTYFVKISEQTLEKSPDDLDLKKVEKLIKDTIKEKILYSYETAMGDNVDIFSIIGRFYKRFGIKKDLKDIEWDIKIKVTVK